MLAYDLFSGAGGASTGLAALGLTVVGFDAWDVACQSHEANGHRTVHADLNTIDWSTYPRPELVWASPPCQPFSAAGKQAGAADDRDGMPAFLRAVDELAPRVVVMENVKGLTWAKHRWYLERCVKQLEAFGYVVDWRVLNCADYGVPQTRERLILIGRRDGGQLAWPAPTHAREPGLLGELPWVSMAEALGWGMTARQYPTIASARKSGGPDKEKVGGSGARAALYAERDAGRWVHERPATTISGDSRVWPPGHKVNQADRDRGHGDRYQGRAGVDAIRVSVEQAAILQGFPPGYRFVGSRTAQFQQVGNACPPALVTAVVRALL